MTKKELIRLLRKAAPEWTWVVVEGEMLVDYATAQYPWGRKIPGLLIREPKCKVAGYYSRTRRYEGDAWREMRKMQTTARDSTLAIIRGLGGAQINGTWGAVPS